MIYTGVSLLSPNRTYIIMFLVCLFSLVNSISGCLKSEEEETPSDGDGFEIYLLKDPTIVTWNLTQQELHSANPTLIRMGNVSYDNSSDQSIDTLLSDTPLWSTDDLIYYNWTDHSFKLTSEAIKRIPKEIHVFGKPFVVKVDEENIYFGSFYTSISSYLPDLPIITVDFLGEKDTFQISTLQGSPNYQLVNSTIVKNALQKSGKLIE